jgi:hypothetical protein
MDVQIPRIFALAAVNSPSLSTPCAFQITELLELVTHRRIRRSGFSGVVLSSRLILLRSVVLLLLLFLGLLLVLLRVTVRLTPGHPVVGHNSCRAGHDCGMCHHP